MKPEIQYAFLTSGDDVMDWIYEKGVFLHPLYLYIVGLMI